VVDGIVLPSSEENNMTDKHQQIRAAMSKDEWVDEISKHTLEIPTLESRNVDRLDFHELSVWAIRRALEQAYEAGFEQGALEAIAEAVMSESRAAAQLNEALNSGDGSYRP